MDLSFSGGDGTRIVSMNLLAKMMDIIARCPECFGQLVGLTERRLGLKSTLSLCCKDCGKSYNFDLTEGDINLQLVAAMSGIGGDRAEAVRFCSAMNLPQPVSGPTFHKHLHKVSSAMQEVADECMVGAAKECQEEYRSKEVIASFDGTWRKRGFSSRHGVTTCLSVAGKASKVLDVEVLSSFCLKCSVNKRKLSVAAFNLWYKGHAPECEINHTGSAGAMEPCGIKAIFDRSLSKRGLIYKGYLGDGDSKSFHTVATANPPIYPSTQIEKLECCGHVQKKMYRKLTDLVVKHKGEEFFEGGKKYKGIGGVNRLTNYARKRIQGYFGSAIRKNVGDVEAMKKDIWANYHHRSGKHEFCPT